MKANEYRQLKKDILLDDKLVLGLDVSSSKCGFAFMKNKVLLKYDYLLLDDKNENSETEIYNKSKKLEKYLEENISKVDYVVLEDKMKTFNGRTTADTLMKLSYINSITQFVIKNNNIQLLTVHPSTARKEAWGKSKFKNVKKDIINLCSSYYNISFPLKRKPSTNYVDYADDICDAITLAKSLLDTHEK